MTIHIREWTQNQWTNAGVSLQRAPGDYSDLVGLVPTPDQRALRRLPGFSAVVTHDVDTVKGAFYDYANDRVVLIGLDGTTYVHQYFSAAWSASSLSQNIATSDLRGRRYLNAIYWGGKLWTAFNNSGTAMIRHYTDYTSSATNETSVTPTAFIPLADRMYYVNDSGVIYRRNDAGTGWEAYFTPVTSYTLLWAGALKSQIVIVALHLDGSILIHLIPHYDQVPTNPILQKVYHLPVSSPSSALATPQQYAVWRDKLYLAPAPYPLPSGEYQLDLYSFSGGLTRLVTSVKPAAVPYVGLTVWRDQLLLYAMSATATTIYTLQGSALTQFGGTYSIAAGASYEPHVTGIGRHLVICTSSGLYHAGNATAQDGYLVTSWLDMGSPGKLKRLEAITALLDSAAASFSVVLKYRTDNNTSWTTASTTTNSRRPVATSLGVEFYTLQIRLDIDDDSGSHHDIRILALSAIYSIND